jgi:predicted RNA-binding Zn ribbon-like protein
MTVPMVTCQVFYKRLSSSRWEPPKPAGQYMSAIHTPRPSPFFVGDHLALDFLNTVATPSSTPIEWLADGADLLDWLKRAGAIDERIAGYFRGQRQELDAVAEQARDLREWFRGFVMRHAGTLCGPTARRELEPLNRLLAEDEIYRQVVAGAENGAHRDVLSPRHLRWVQFRRWDRPQRLLQPLAEAIGDLVCDADFRLVRACEGAGCTLVFYDRTKRHARRWCSMRVCGNRAKAAAHRARLRGVRLGVRG